MVEVNASMEKCSNFLNVGDNKLSSSGPIEDDKNQQFDPKNHIDAVSKKFALTRAHISHTFGSNGQKPIFKDIQNCEYAGDTRAGMEDSTRKAACAVNVDGTIGDVESFRHGQNSKSGNLQPQDNKHMGSPTFPSIPGGVSKINPLFNSLDLETIKAPSAFIASGPSKSARPGSLSASTIRKVHTDLPHSCPVSSASLGQTVGPVRNALPFGYTAKHNPDAFVESTNTPSTTTLHAKVPKATATSEGSLNVTDQGEPPARPVHSWASLVTTKSSNGFNLSYIKPQEGTDRSHISIPKEVFVEGSHPWQNTLVGYFIGKRSPTLLSKMQLIDYGGKEVSMIWWLLTRVFSSSNSTVRKKAWLFWKEAHGMLVGSQYSYVNGNQALLSPRSPSPLFQCGFIYITFLLSSGIR